jgi:hypothetical protein
LEEAQWRRGDVQERGRIAQQNKKPNIHYYDDWSSGVPVHMGRNEDTDETFVVSGTPAGPKAQPGQAPTSTQPEGSPFPSLKGVNSGFGAQQPQAQPQAPPTAAQGRPPSDTDKQKGYQTQVARARQKFPDYSDYINWNDETKLPEIDKPEKSWGSMIGVGDEWTPYDWNTYDEINKFIFGPDFKRFNPLEQQITGTEDNRSSGSTGSTSGGTRTTSRGTVVTRID